MDRFITLYHASEKKKKKKSLLKYYYSSISSFFSFLQQSDFYHFFDAIPILYKGVNFKNLIRERFQIKNKGN